MQECCAKDTEKRFIENMMSLISDEDHTAVTNDGNAEIPTNADLLVGTTDILFSRTVNSGTVVNPSDDVKRIQNRLIELEYLQDRADGVFGKKTELAVSEFQKASGLPVNGEVDNATYGLLFPHELPSSEQTEELSLLPYAEPSPEPEMITEYTPEPSP